LRLLNNIANGATAINRYQIEASRIQNITPEHIQAFLTILKLSRSASYVGGGQ
jgi:hypothetical protein